MSLPKWIPFINDCQTNTEKDLVEALYIAHQALEDLNDGAHMFTPDAIEARSDEALRRIQQLGEQTERSDGCERPLTQQGEEGK